MTTAAQQDPIVIVGQARTPMGGFLGELASIKATELGATAIRAAVARAGLDASDVDEVNYGLCAAGRLGSGARATGLIGRGHPQVHRHHNDQ